MAKVYILLALLCGINICASQCPRVRDFDARRKGEIKEPTVKRWTKGFECTYKIKAPVGYRIKLTFKNLDIPLSTRCMTDRLTVYGQGKKHIIGTFCGKKIPRPVLSHEDENEIVLSYQTNTRPGGKFTVEFSSGLHIDICDSKEGICRNRNCYRVQKHCDGVDDCGDGSDEENCGFPVKLPSNKDCGKPPINPRTIYGSPDRMVGGEYAVANSWPWHVSIQDNLIEPNGHFCAGALISPQWVLTAARCFANAPHTKSVRIHVGGHQKYIQSKYEQVRTAEMIISYPDLQDDELKKFDEKDDIALVKLNSPVLLTKGVQTACLPLNGWESRMGWNCYTTSWDQTASNDQLKQSVQVIKSANQCKYNNDKQICAEQSSHGPCQDDKGAPLVCKLAAQWYLFGVANIGLKKGQASCASMDANVLYTKVSGKAGWIKQTINKHS